MHTFKVGISYVCIYIYMYIYLVICMYIPHPRSQHSQGQEKFLAPSADKQTCSYDTECSNHHLPYQS